MRPWFKRFADVPKVNYSGHPTIDRTRLPGHDTEAKRSYWKDEENKRHESLMWVRAADDTNSSSPAWTHWMNFDNRHKPSTPQETIQRAFESLELPGTLNDYNWTLQSVSSFLWSARKTEPRVLKAIEQFCWQDIRLLEAYPKLNDHLELDFEQRFSSFDHLIELYSREGFLGEALTLVRRAQKLTQHESYTELFLELTERLNGLAVGGN